MEAYKHQATCAQSVVKMLQAMKEENWSLPVMYTVCLDLRLLAQKCEEVEGSHVSKPGEILEKAAECLMGCFRVCAADNRYESTRISKHGNIQFEIYFPFPIDLPMTIQNVWGC